MSDRLVAFGRLLLTTEKRFLSLVSVLSGKLQIPAVKAEIVASAYIRPATWKFAVLLPQRGQPRWQVLSFDVSVTVFHRLRLRTIVFRGL